MDMMKRLVRLLWVLILVTEIQSCTTAVVKSKPTLFTLLPADSTGIHFVNEIVEDENFNPLQYENSYNGGGVAIGDVNNDGLEDVYLSSNRKGNKLYLNKGNLKFEDVTSQSLTGGRQGWSTGIGMADVNGDGYLDIYVCHSGNLPGYERENELFINQGPGKDGIPVFKEKAEAWGIADSAFSMQAAFFDYDRDGDLDMVLLNHSPIRFNNLDESAIHYLMNQPDSLTGLKFYKNDQDHFTDVTSTCGIKNSRLNFNLGISVSDVNNDGWPDMYISNDYFAPDYLYINKGNGTFTNELPKQMSETSEFSMGNDIADINNDGRTDIYTLDMLPEDNRRQKLLFGGDNYELFDIRIKSGLNAQYMRNMLHVNNGNGSFSEIGQLANVSNTDWSWAPLLADLDNDGLKDIFVSNGYLRDYTNMDFLKYMGDFLKEKQEQVHKEHLLELVKKMPSSDVRNYAFKNTDGVQFSNVAAAWGLNAVSNSSGAAYADLDNDGDLDLVINNINLSAFVYKNNTEEDSHRNYLRIKLNGEGGNRFGIGAKVQLFINGSQHLQEQMLTRGYQSSVSPVMVFGTGQNKTIDSVIVTWPKQRQQVIANQQCNTQVTLTETDAKNYNTNFNPSFRPVFTSNAGGTLQYTSPQNVQSDFKRQPLMINALSYSGPCMAKADVNGDGREDLFIGGAAGYEGAIFLQSGNWQFIKSPKPALKPDAASHDASAVFFDANGDGKADLFVASGGYDNFQPGDEALLSRLYLNDGRGNFTRSINALPKAYTSSGVVAAGDINGDGFPDIFLGGRVVPGRYPQAPFSFILLNDGNGIFHDATSQVCPGIANAGMFTSAAFADMDGDGQQELVTAGEWMPIRIWKIINGRLIDKSSDFMEANTSGWWNTLVVKDINNDGRPDIVAGNNGLNSQWKASNKEPVEMIYKDFDDNGAIDPIFCYYIQGKSYPYISRDELLDQMSIMRTRFTNYKSYANAGLTNIFSADELKGAKKLTANTMRTTVWISSPNGKLVENPLPVQAQYSPVFAIGVEDFNNDGKTDLLLGGNTNYAKVKIGCNKSSEGQFFAGDGRGNFTYVPQPLSGLNVKGEIRSFCTFNNILLAGINGRPVKAFQFKRSNKTGREIAENRQKKAAIF